MRTVLDTTGTCLPLQLSGRFRNLHHRRLQDTEQGKRHSNVTVTPLDLLVSYLVISGSALMTLSQADLAALENSVGSS